MGVWMSYFWGACACMGPQPGEMLCPCRLREEEYLLRLRLIALLRIRKVSDSLAKHEICRIMYQQVYDK